MPTTYRIHPGIGIARLGNSPDEFCISPEVPAGLPLACDADGNVLTSPDGKTELTVTRFKDEEGRIKRQAARFQVYVYDDESPEGRPLKIGDPVSGGGNHGTLVDIQWQVYVANKKASWFEFQQLSGEHGYAPDHPRRNPQVTAPEARQQLIIDPGPRTVSRKGQRTARFDRDGWDVYAPSFPPPLAPHSIDTLGEIKTDDAGRLLVLGGHGHSGTYLTDEFGQPRIDSYAQTDGWFDDTSDGPVMARLVMYSEQVTQQRFIDVEYPAWVICAYPAYVPEILDMVTAEEVVETVAITQFASRTDLYGEAGKWDDPGQVRRRNPEDLAVWKAGRLQWNPTYRPWFYRDIWPILFRPDQYSYTSNVLGQSNFPHNQSKRGNMDPYRLGVPPSVDRERLHACERSCVKRHHRGDLFVETLASAFLLLEREAKAELADHDHGHAPLRVLSNEVAMRLRQAVAAFAERMMGPTDGEDADGYARAWRNLSGHPDHGAAKAELEAAVLAAVESVVPARAAGHGDADAGQAGARAEPPGRPVQPRDMAASGDDVVYQKLAARARVAALEHLAKLHGGRLLEACRAGCLASCTYDPYRDYRMYLFELVREPGEENRFGAGGKPDSRTRNLPLMPLLAGDNPISNLLPSKFLRLTDYQYYLLRQWAHGLFHNEELEGWGKVDPFNPYANWVNRTGRDLDRGVLSNLAGGAFCPGCEVGWVIRNPAAYLEPYRIKADSTFSAFRQTAAQANALRGSVPENDYASYVEVALSQDNDFAAGLQPGDLTKYMGLPWQADFNECSTQDIDITYELWNEIYPASGDDVTMAREQRVWETLWWPAHRPLQVYQPSGWKGGVPTGYVWVSWSPGVPQTYAGDLKMVTEWWRLGFVIKNPFMGTPDVEPSEVPPPSPPPYISVERTPRAPQEER